MSRVLSKQSSPLPPLSLSLPSPGPATHSFPVALERFLVQTERRCVVGHFVHDGGSANSGEEASATVMKEAYQRENFLLGGT